MLLAGVQIDESGQRSGDGSDGVPGQAADSGGHHTGRAPAGSARGRRRGAAFIIGGPRGGLCDWRTAAAGCPRHVHRVLGRVHSSGRRQDAVPRRLMVASTAVAAATSTSVLGPIELKLRVAVMFALVATCYDLSDIDRGDSLRSRREVPATDIYMLYIFVAHITN